MTKQLFFLLPIILLINHKYGLIILYCKKSSRSLHLASKELFQRVRV